MTRFSLAHGLVLSALVCPLSSQSDEIQITVNPEFGIPMKDFIKLAGVYTGKSFDYRQQDIAGKRVRFGGTAEMKNSEFLAFFVTVLYRLRLRCAPTAGGKFRITALPKSAPVVAPLRSANYLQPRRMDAQEELDEFLVLTSVPVPEAARTRVAAALRDKIPRGVEVGRLPGDARIVLQGPGESVRRAYRVIRLLGLPPRPTEPEKGSFRRLVPRDACAAAMFDIQPEQAVRTILAISSTEESLRRTEKELGKGKPLFELLDRIQACLEPRLGIVVRPNDRTVSTKKLFPVQSRRRSPQWALVFRLRRDRSGAPMAKPFRELGKLLNENRRAFGIRRVYKLSLKNTEDKAYEFSMSHVPATGSLAMAVVDGHAFLSNSGPLLSRMTGSTDPTFRPELLSTNERGSTRGLAWVDGVRLPKVVKELGRKETAKSLRLGNLDEWLRFAFGN